MISGRSRKGRKRRSGTDRYNVLRICFGPRVSPLLLKGEAVEITSHVAFFLWLLPAYAHFRLQAFPALQLCCVATVFAIVLYSYVMAGADDQENDDVVSREEAEYQAAIDAAVHDVHENPQVESGPTVTQFPGHTSQSGTQFHSAFPVQSHACWSCTWCCIGVSSSLIDFAGFTLFWTGVFCTSIWTQWSGTGYEVITHTSSWRIGFYSGTN